MNAPDLLAPVRSTVARHKHDTARQAELDDATKAGHFDPDPYSRYSTPTTFDAECGCVYDNRRRAWDDGDCLREQEEMREEG